MEDEARLTHFAIERIDDGKPGFQLETPFGQEVNVLPRPPAFRATLTLEWEGAMPDDVEAFARRARAAGLDAPSA